MNTIVLYVDGKKEAQFKIDGTPKTEKELLENEAYKKFYYRVGLGAPVEATVTVTEGFFKKSSYQFSFAIEGNAISFDELDSIVGKYKKHCKCEGMNYITDKGIDVLLYSFTDGDKAFQMYSEVKDICNIGAYHMVDKDTGLHLVKIDYHRQ